MAHTATPLSTALPTMGKPLYCSTNHGHTAVIKDLLAHGADVNKADKEAIEAIEMHCLSIGHSWSIAHCPGVPQP